MDWYTSSRCFLVTPLPPAVPSSLPLSLTSSIALFVCHPPSPALFTFPFPPCRLPTSSFLHFFPFSPPDCLLSFLPSIHPLHLLTLRPSLTSPLASCLSHTPSIPLPSFLFMSLFLRPSFYLPPSLLPSVPSLSLPASLSSILLSYHNVPSYVLASQRSELLFQIMTSSQ